MVVDRKEEEKRESPTSQGGGSVLDTVIETRLRVIGSEQLVEGREVQKGGDLGKEPDGIESRKG